MSVCTAAAALIPNVCPGFVPCDPNTLSPGDKITIQLCVDNASERPTFGAHYDTGKGGRRPTPSVKASFVAPANIDVFLMCKTGACKDQFHDLFTVDSYTSAAGVNSTFHLGATARCYEPSACGRITLAEPMPLDADSGLRTCVGTIYATATNVPTGTSTGIFYIRATTDEADVLITDDRCLPGITGGAQGQTVARFLLPPPPSPSPSPPPPSPSPPPPPPPSPTPPPPLCEDGVLTGGKGKNKGEDYDRNVAQTITPPLRWVSK